MSFLDSMKISQPVSLTGASGKYWRVAAGDKGEFFVRLRFEDGMMASPYQKGQAVPGAVLQGNVIYRGEQFDIPEPFKYLTKRGYYDDAGKPTEAILIGKFWCPMGEFYKNVKAMHEYLADSGLADTIQERLEPLFDAADAKSTFTLKQLADMMIAELAVVERFKMPPTVFVNEEYKDSQKALKKSMDSKYKGEPEQGDEGLGPDDAP